MRASVLHVTVALAAMTTIPGVAAHAQTFTTLYSFKGIPDGMAPYGALLFLDGALYGTTYLGGTGPNDSGTLFKVDLSTRKETVLHDFVAPDGTSSTAALIDVGGTMYGTTLAGGATGRGTVFAFDPRTRRETILYSFADSPDGAYPVAALAYRAGALYGTTGGGGAIARGAPCRNLDNQPVGCGTAFKLDLSTGAETLLHTFRGGAAGESPDSALLYANGMFYGTTRYGGTAAGGTLFAIKPGTGATSILHSFSTQIDGAWPVGGLTAFAGALYGTTSAGTKPGHGGVFRLDIGTGTVSVLHRFSGDAEGLYPEGLIAQGGGLYGVMGGGGTSANGTLYKIDPVTETVTVLHDFAGSPHSNYPSAGLTYHNGMFYGVTTTGDFCCGGTVFAFSEQ